MAPARARCILQCISYTEEGVYMAYTLHHGKALDAEPIRGRVYL